MRCSHIFSGQRQPLTIKAAFGHESRYVCNWGRFSGPANIGNKQTWDVFQEDEFASSRNSGSDDFTEEITFIRFTSLLAGDRERLARETREYR